jgi:hypothetical protein
VRKNCDDEKYQSRDSDAFIGFQYPSLSEYEKGDLQMPHPKRKLRLSGKRLKRF